jgi:V8-like Glu-specific endopeptidase
VSEISPGRMQNPHWIVRIYAPTAAESQNIVGAGVLLDDSHVLTCAHVVESAYHPRENAQSRIPPEGATVVLDFPNVPASVTSAVVVSEEYRPADPDDRGDVAILRLLQPAPAGISPAPLGAVSAVGHECRVLGFPKGKKDGRWAVGTVRGAAGPDWTWQQFDESGSSRIEHGFSGSPVWDDDQRCVVGIIVARDKSRGVDVSYLLPIPVLASSSTFVRRALAAARDPRNSAVWGSRYRGVESPVLKGDHFTGRLTALRRISEWCRGVSGDETLWSPPVCIITGGPGSGKSALLARVIVLANEYVLSTGSGAALLRKTPKDARPPAGVVKAAIDLQGRTLLEAALALAYAFELEIDGKGDPREVAGRVIHAIRQSVAATESTADGTSMQPIIAVMDSLDDAASSDDIVSELVLPLTARGTLGRGIHLLLGVRAKYLPIGNDPIDSSILIPGLSSALVLNLDDDTLIEERDLQLYSMRLLLADDVATKNPYKSQPKLAKQLSAAIARRAYPNFLVAQLTSRSYAEADDAIDVEDHPSLMNRLPASVGQAFDGYLRRFGSDEQRLRDLLAPLAWAAGGAQISGDDLWVSIANEISGESYNRSDLRWLFRSSAASFLLEHTANAQEFGYRLYHSALAQHLRDWQLTRERQSPRAINDRIVSALLRHIPSVAGYGPDESTPSWSDAPTYVKANLAVHAAWADRLDEFVSDPFFVVASDLERLLLCLSSLTTTDAARAGEVLRLTADQLRTCHPSDRLAYLKLSALRYGYTEYAVRIGDRLDLPWIPRWAISRPLHPSLNIARHPGVVDIATAEYEGRVVLLSAGAEGTIQARDLLTGRILREGTTGTPFKSLAATTWQGRLIAIGLSDAGLTVIDVGAGYILGSPQPIPLSISKSSHEWMDACVLDGALYVLYGNESGAWRHDVSSTEYNPWGVEGESGYSGAIVADLDGRPQLVGQEGYEKETRRIVCTDLQSGAVSYFESTSTLLEGALRSSGKEFALTMFESEAAIATADVRSGINIRRLADGSLLGHFELTLDEIPIAICGTRDSEFDLATADALGALRAWNSGVAKNAGDDPGVNHGRDRFFVSLVSRPGLTLNLADGSSKPAALVAHSSGLNFVTSSGTRIRILGHKTDLLTIALESGQTLTSMTITGTEICTTHVLRDDPLTLACGSFSQAPLFSLNLRTKEIIEFGEQVSASCMAGYSRDEGTVILTGERTGENRVTMYDFDDSGSLNEGFPTKLLLPNGRPSSMAFVTYDGRPKLAVTHESPSSLVHILDFPSLSEELSFDLGEGCACNVLVGFTKYLLSGTTDGRFLMTDMETRRHLHVIDVGFMPTALALRPPNIVLIAGVGDLVRIDLT